MCHQWSHWAGPSRSLFVELGETLRRVRARDATDMEAARRDQQAWEHAGADSEGLEDIIVVAARVRAVQRGRKRLHTEVLESTAKQKRLRKARAAREGQNVADEGDNAAVAPEPAVAARGPEAPAAVVGGAARREPAEQMPGARPQSAPDPDPHGSRREYYETLLSTALEEIECMAAGPDREQAMRRLAERRAEFERRLSFRRLRPVLAG